MNNQTAENKDLWRQPSAGFSFRYGESTLTGFPAEWAPQTTGERLPDGASVERVSARDPQSGLIVTQTIQRYADFPALEWVMEFENSAAADAPILEAVFPLDVTLPVPPAERLRLHHANGSECRKDDFLPLLSELPPNSRKTLTPAGGRSSDGGFPFMNLQLPGGGLIIAIGWTGQWAVNFERSTDSIRISGGMERIHLRLHPGEKIRTPRILLLPWQGEDMEIGQNMLRQLLLAHILPRINGELVLPPAAQCLQAYFYLTGQAGEAYEMKALPRVAGLGAEVYWIDACWYGGQEQWWEEVGSWEVNRQRFPNGLKPISDAAHQAGMKFLLWFEPERARLKSRLAQEHPEFFLSCAQDPDNLLFNLGNPQARAYLTELISRRITEFGIDIYRQDFNFQPLPYWVVSDAPDRVGMSEIRHIEGLYTFWDELRQRHPGLWIDNCSSGGRRIDIETLSRSLPLWPSDFSDVIGLTFGQGLNVGDQCINAGLARWVPLFGGGVWNFTPYGTRSQIIGGFTIGVHIDRDKFPADDASMIYTHNDVLALGKTLLDEEFPVEAAGQAIAEWKSIRPYFTGDFHLLLPLTVADHDWCAYQLHRPDLAGGVALVFRRHHSPFPTMEISLKWIEPQAVYEVSISEDYEPGLAQRCSGEDLQNIAVELPQAPGSVLIRYNKIG